MQHSTDNYETGTSLEEDYIQISASGLYSMPRTENLFRFVIDHTLAHNKKKLFLDLSRIHGHIPVFDRLAFSKFMAAYYLENALGKIKAIAVLGNEEIIDKNRFGETVAVNRGVNVRVFLNSEEALGWLKGN